MPLCESDVAGSLPLDASDDRIILEVLDNWEDYSTYQPAKVDILNRAEVIAAVRAEMKRRKEAGES